MGFYRTSSKVSYVNAPIKSSLFCSSNSALYEEVTAVHTTQQVLHYKSYTTIADYYSLFEYHLIQLF